MYCSTLKSVTGHQKKYPSLLDNGVIPPHDDQPTTHSPEDLELVAKVRFRKAGQFDIQLGFGTHSEETPVTTLHMADATGTYVLCTWDGQTYHRL
jgi:hypothetical protein